MTIRHLRIIGAVAFGLLALTAVNLWQAWMRHAPHR